MLLSGLKLADSSGALRLLDALDLQAQAVDSLRRTARVYRPTAAATRIARSGLTCDVAGLWEAVVKLLKALDW